VSDGSPALHLYAADFTALRATLPLAPPPGPWRAAAVPPPTCPGLTTAWATGGEGGALPPLGPQAVNWRLNELEYVPGALLDDAWAAACRQQTTSSGGGGPLACPARLPEGVGMPPSAGGACDGGAEVWAAVQGCGHLLRIHACSGTVVGWGTLTGPPVPTTVLSPALAEVASGRGRGRGGAARERGSTQGVLSAGGSDDKPGAADPQATAGGSWLQQQHSQRGDMNGIAVCTANGGGLAESSGTGGGSGDAVVVIGGKRWERLFAVSLVELVGQWLRGGAR
jgi:hypothetical protein